MKDLVELKTESANRISRLFEKTKDLHREVAEALAENCAVRLEAERETDRLREEVGDWISRGVAYEKTIAGLQTKASDMRQAEYVATGRELKLQAKVRTACIQFWLMALVALFNIVVGILL